MEFDRLTFPFLAAKLTVVFELALVILIGLLPWTDQFARLCGFFFGFVIGIFLLQPRGTSRNVLQLANISTITKLEEKPIRQCLWKQCCKEKSFFRDIMKGSLLCISIVLCTTNVLWLYQSHDIGDLPCRKCRYLNCAPLTSSLSRQCDPCNYINIEFVIHDRLNSTIKYDLDGNRTVNIEMICPYGETSIFTTSNIPNDRYQWIELCHNYCEL